MGPSHSLCGFTSLMLNCNTSNQYTIEVQTFYQKFSITCLAEREDMQRVGETEESVRVRLRQVIRCGDA